MSNEPIVETPPVEVDKPTQQEGEVKFGSKKAFFALAPARMKLVVRSIQGTFGSIITILSATDWLSGGQVKTIATVAGIVSAVLEGLLKATGVVPLDDK